MRKNFYHLLAASLVLLGIVLSRPPSTFAQIAGTCNDTNGMGLCACSCPNNYIPASNASQTCYIQGFCNGACTCYPEPTPFSCSSITDPIDCGLVPGCSWNGTCIGTPPPPPPNTPSPGQLNGPCTTHPAYGANWCEGGLVCTSGICLAPGNPPSTVEFRYDLCSGVRKGTDHTQCTACFQQHGIWTGLGCINFNPIEFVANLLQLGAFLGGGFTLLLILYGSFLIATSAGVPEQIQKGKEVVTGAITGLLFIIFAVIILEFIGVDILGIPGL